MLRIAIAVGLSIVSLSSCKKDYTCECRTGEETAIITTSEIKNRTFKDAKTACENGSGTSFGVTKTCKLK